MASTDIDADDVQCGWRTTSGVFSNVVTSAHFSEPEATTTAKQFVHPSDEEETDGSVAGSYDERKRMKRLLKGMSIFFESMPRDVVLVQSREIGVRRSNREDDADVVWLEQNPPSWNRLKSLVEHQRVNCFVGMKVLATKCEFGRVVNMARTVLSSAGETSAFDFIPRTFVLPGDRRALDEFAKYQQDVSEGTSFCDDKQSSQLKRNLKHSREKHVVYVVKPDAGCGGDGIYLTDNVSDIRHRECVVQEYIGNPILLGGLKFDLRLYILVTSLSPLRFYVHKEGLARFAVEPYIAPSKGNFHKTNMHLTNYSLNKFSSTFVPNLDSRDDTECSKRTITTAFSQLRAAYGGKFDEDSLWGSIQLLVEKTLNVLLPSLLLGVDPEVPYVDHCASKSFQLMGFDVLLDEYFEPHLLEINHHPSLLADAPVDMLVKGELMRQVLRMISYRYVKAMKPKQFACCPFQSEEAWEVAHCGEKFIPFTASAGSMCPVFRYFCGPLFALSAVFVMANGSYTSKTFFEMTSLRFVKFARKIGFVPDFVPSSEVDLIFIRRANVSGSTVMDFLDFAVTLMDEFGQYLAPTDPPRSYQRLSKLVRFCSQSKS